MDKKLYWASIVFTVIGLAVSIYTTIEKLTNHSRMCLGNGNCQTVLSSSYAEIRGFPVSGVGIIGYVAILVALILEVKGGRFFKENATLAIFGMTLIGFLFTLYLIYLEIFVIKALCPFCVTSQVSMTILFVISLIRFIKQPLD